MSITDKLQLVKFTFPTHYLDSVISHKGKIRFQLLF